jgi:hypothetical protein
MVSNLEIVLETGFDGDKWPRVQHYIFWQFIVLTIVLLVKGVKPKGKMVFLEIQAAIIPSQLNNTNQFTEWAFSISKLFYRQLSHCPHRKCFNAFKFGRYCVNKETLL